ncbi:MAG: phosphoribosyltransferase family protein [Proteobacteria bacterium]|nr:phosphoribosyltransferase family protein [Pseudomonadota bacterium]
MSTKLPSKTMHISLNGWRVTHIVGIFTGLALITVKFRLNHLLPRNCVLCDTDCAGAIDLCEHCLPTLAWNTHCCSRCALPISSAYPACPACSTFDFDCAVVPLRFETEVARLVQRLKFNNGRVEARILGQILLAAVTARYANARWPELIVPVPLSATRLRRRGYNQAILLASQIARKHRIPIIRHAIRRRHRPPQQTLTAAERATNLVGSFTTTRTFGGTLAIVDDVLTTGATVNELSRLLLARGASEIHVWCAARAPLEAIARGEV